MIHVVAAEGKSKRERDEAVGWPLGDFRNYAEALAAIGRSIDEGTDGQVICFYVYDDGRPSWTMVANLQ